MVRTEFDWLILTGSSEFFGEFPKNIKRIPQRWQLN